MGILFRAERYRYVINSISGESISRAKFIILTSVRNALVDFFPARLGEASYLYMLNRLGVSVLKGVSSFGLCLALDLIVLLALLSLLFVGTYSLREFDSLIIIVLLSGVSFVFVYNLEKVIDVVIFILNWIDKNFCFLKRARDFIQDSILKIRSDIVQVKVDGLFVKLIFLTAGLRFAKYTSLYILLCAVVYQWGLGVEDLKPFEAVIAFISAEASASLPISGFMGFGAYEGAAAAGISLSCGEACSEVPTLAVVFSVHLITQITGYSVGAIGALAFAGLLGASKKNAISN